MLKFAAIALSAALVVPAVYAQQAEPTQVAQDVAQRWMVLVDAGNHDASWEAAASTFRAAVTKEQWASLVQGARAPLGALKTRTLSSTNQTRSLPGFADGDYVVLQYRADYANRDGTTETLVVMRDTDGWKVTTYLIQ